jgi:ABC-type transport system involved in multi-copper enzyme maturation permease subunit
MILDLLDVVIDLLNEIRGSRGLLIGCLITFVGTLSIMLIAIGKYDWESVAMSVLVTLLVSIAFCVIAGILYKIIHK